MRCVDALLTQQLIGPPITKRIAKHPQPSPTFCRRVMFRIFLRITNPFYPALFFDGIQRITRSAGSAGSTRFRSMCIGVYRWFHLSCSVALRLGVSLLRLRRTTGRNAYPTSGWLCLTPRPPRFSGSILARLEHLLQKPGFTIDFAPLAREDALLTLRPAWGSCLFLGVS